MITVAETQQGAIAAELRKRRQAESIGQDLSAGQREAAGARGFEHGPAEGVMPGHPEPENLRRGYLDGGHGASSPQSEPPRRNPLPSLPPGIVTPVTLPDAPFAATIHPTIAAGFTLGSPSDR
jgi:hypothetical protein